MFDVRSLMLKKIKKKTHMRLKTLFTMSIYLTITDLFQDFRFLTQRGEHKRAQTSGNCSFFLFAPRIRTNREQLLAIDRADEIARRESNSTSRPMKKLIRVVESRFALLSSKLFRCEKIRIDETLD